ncbi:DUF2202 domain-containing protein [Pengzhenrongella phosphoraccumulans]|uniref:DUF2202 domain-containing protein n=1 Tax=Pengzhenrongella phosphoraccumulans TaxID=3114394 RepID=UPI00388D60F7
MRTRARVATVIASGVLATALLASPSLAAGQRGGPASGQATPDPQSTQVAGTCDGSGTWLGTRSGVGSGRNGQGTAGQGTAGQGRGAGMGTGTDADLTDVASGTLTDAQRSALAAVAEDEKLAHDLYVALGDSYSVRVFDRIAAAETQHLTEVRILLDRYEIADPTAGLAAGTFASAEFQAQYDTQLAAGSVDLAAAYEVGVLIEQTDIADLKAAAADLVAPDVEQVYANLLAGSERHLAAFGG